jgi:lipopolysaccharide heptosyltransferase I
MHVVIVKLSSIGDVVHTLPAAALLRRSLVGAEICWVVERRASAILNGSPAIDRLIELDTGGWRHDFLKARALADIRRQLRALRGCSHSNGAARPEIALDFQGLIKSGLVTFASGARNRIGFESADLREKASRLFLTEQVETSRFTHVIDKNLAVARAAISLAGGSQGEVPGRYEFPIAVTEHDEQYVQTQIENHPGAYAIINPGGGWPTKLWPPSRYAELGDWLWSECGLRSFVTYGPGEDTLAEAVAGSSRSGMVRPIASTLKQFVALARRAGLFVGGDTGPLHLAAASGTPIVGLYGPTSPARNGPFDPQDITVGRDLWCRADCHRRRCWHWECMDISVNDVKAAVLKRLAASVNRAGPEIK